jgi:hypothetical protein
MAEVLEGEADFLDAVLTGDETWFFQYDPETKCQSSEWRTKGSPRPKKARMAKSKVKTMLIVFLTTVGWYTASLCLKDKLSTLLSTKTSLRDCTKT